MSDYAVPGNTPNFLYVVITREDFAALILRSLCVSIAFVSSFVYDQADQHELKVMPFLKYSTFCDFSIDSTVSISKCHETSKTWMIAKKSNSMYYLQ